MRNDYGTWQARVIDDFGLLDEVRLVIYMRLPQGGRQLVGWDENGGWPITEEVLEGGAMRSGFRIPREAIDSLREQLTPTPSEELVKELRAALAIERARVDAILAGHPDLAVQYPVHDPETMCTAAGLDSNGEPRHQTDVPCRVHGWEPGSGAARGVTPPMYDQTIQQREETQP